MIVFLFVVLGTGSIVGMFVRSAFKGHRDHRPRLLELVEKQEQKLLAPPPVREERKREEQIRKWNYPTVRPGHAPSAAGYARMADARVNGLQGSRFEVVPMPVPGSGVKRSG